MAKHYGRDAYLPDLSMYGVNQTGSVQILYHMLRVAGCDWLWECDGDVGPRATNPSHVTDGNMQAAGVTDWDKVGGSETLVKDTVNFVSGVQSLSVTSTTSGDGVRSKAFASITPPVNEGPFASSNYLTGPVNNIMTFHRASIAAKATWVGNRVTFSGCVNSGNNGTFEVTRCVSGGGYYFYNPSGTAEDMSGSSPSKYTVINYRYELCIYALNNTGFAWNVQVDPGTGSYGAVGTIPSDGVWKLYHFTYYVTGSGSNYVQIVDSAIGGHTINIQSINVFRSHFEYRSRNVYGTQGAITNPDLFDTSGDSYTPTTDDVDKFLFTWDADHPENSGYYKIIGVSGGKYQLDLRSGTATLTTHATTNLPWRIVPVQDQVWESLTICPAYVTGAGFGLETPHTSKWRFFNRLAGSGSVNPSVVWAAPTDVDFDHSTGTFYKDEPSTQRWRTGDYVSGGPNQHFWCGDYTSTTGSVDRSSRDWFMTDDDLSFFAFFHWSNLTSPDHAHLLVGYMGADADHPGVQEFALLAKYGSPANVQEATFNGGSLQNGTVFDPEERAAKCTASVLGYATTTLSVIGQANACPNPWSGEEHLDPLILVRDPDYNQFCPSEREADVGVYMARTNLPPLSTFDSANYLHFANGLVWEWSGESIV